MLLTACNAQIAGGPTATTDAQAVGASPDASTQAPPDAAPLGPWSAPMKITVAAVAGRDDDDETLSANTLEMIYAVTNPQGAKDLFYTHRPSAKSTDWSTPVRLSFTVDGDQTPRLSADDLTLYFASPRATTDGTLDIWKVTRNAAGTNAWNTPTELTTVSTPATEKWYMPCPIKGSPDYIMTQDQGAGTTHLVESTNGDTPTLITQLDSDTGSETGTFLSNDCLTIYFASNRSMRTMIYTSHRTAIGAAWAAPTAVVDYPLTGTDNQEDPWMASDLRTFVFASNAAGDKDVYISTR